MFFFLNTLVIIEGFVRRNAPYMNHYQILIGIDKKREKIDLPGETPQAFTDTASSLHILFGKILQYNKFRNSFHISVVVFYYNIINLEILFLDKRYTISKITIYLGTFILLIRFS
ncbi:hypothetical protein ACJX0J_009963 [Zea mays]